MSSNSLDLLYIAVILRDKNTFIKDNGLLSNINTIKEEEYMYARIYIYQQ